MSDIKSEDESEEISDHKSICSLVCSTTEYFDLVEQFQPERHRKNLTDVNAFKNIGELPDMERVPAKKNQKMKQSLRLISKTK